MEAPGEGTGLHQQQLDATYTWPSVREMVPIRKIVVITLCCLALALIFVFLASTPGGDTPEAKAAMENNIQLVGGMVLVIMTLAAGYFIIKGWMKRSRPSR